MKVLKFHVFLCALRASILFFVYNVKKQEETLCRFLLGFYSCDTFEGVGRGMSDTRSGAADSSFSGVF